jgi:uncharacterized protein
MSYYTHLAKMIGAEEKADETIIVPAALFHDAVVFKKNDPQSSQETDLSSEFASNVLKKEVWYPQEKIPKVAQCIRECSYSKGLKPSSIESAVLQDADRLEAVGAIAIMRTFASCSSMNIPFYPVEDPLCEKKHVDKRSGIDLFYRRLLQVKGQMNTKAGKYLANRRHTFLMNFLVEFRLELVEDGIITGNPGDF